LAVPDFLETPLRLLEKLRSLTVLRLLFLKNFLDPGNQFFIKILKFFEEVKIYGCKEKNMYSQPRLIRSKLSGSFLPME
jgi:hypothetical protein